MLPLRLTLRNFLSYGNHAQTLDFSQISLACLSGLNGVGKSSLLEAMTWAVWGQARAASDNELIRLGALDMEVDFEFSVDDTDYRVIRRRAKKARGGVTSLEFQVRAGDEFRSITEPTIKGTQDKIVKMVGMQYETFVNSAYLRQGRADEFTLKRPNERKEVLSEILGLKYFDLLEMQAREKLKTFAMEHQNLGFVIGALQLEVARKDAVLIEREQVVASATNAQHALHEKAEALTKLRDRERALDLARARTREAEEHERALFEEIASLERQHRDVEREWTEVATLVKERERVDKEHQSLLELKDQLSRLEKKFTKVLALEREREQLDRTLAQALASIESGEQLLEGKKEVLKRDLKLATQAKLELSTLEKQLEKLGNAKESLEKIQHKIHEHKSQIATFESLNRESEREQQVLHERIQSLSKTTKECPLCRQELSKEHLANVKQELEREIAEKGRLLLGNQSKIHTLQQDVVNLDRSGTTLKRELVNLESWQAKKGALEQIMKQGDQLTAELNEIHDQLLILAGEKKEKPTLIALRERLKSIDSELTMLGYDQKTHQTVQAAVEKKLPIVEMKTKLDRAVSVHAVLGKTMTELGVQLTQKRETLKKRSALRSTLLEELKDEPVLKKELTLHVEELRVLELEFVKVQNTLAVHEQTLQLIAQKEEELQNRKREIEKMKKERDVYEDLALAFSKKGVPAMLIETAIPEIEEEANLLLARMTENEMQITIEAERQKKASEGIIETLDIKIADSLGTRPYELFSGGEAFRIDFAIRVALSKLLAHRAGVRLQLLIIDEGFGTQDEFGLEHLVQAINAIRTEFPKILVITHLQALKDAFPERISIVKTPQGSEIEML